MALWFLQAPHGLPGKNNRNPLKVAQGQEVVIARDDQIGKATNGRGQDLIVVGIPTDGTSQISRFHALNQGGIAIKQIGNSHTKPNNGLSELRSLQHAFQLGEERNGTDQLNSPNDGRIDELPGNSLPDQGGESRVGVKNQPQVVAPCGKR